MVARKDFKPTIGHRVCSEHFVGGQKTYLNNVPRITPKTVNVKPPSLRKTSKSRNREPLINMKENIPPETADNDDDNELLEIGGLARDDMSINGELKVQVK